jgi:hypothetical protein
MWNRFKRWLAYKLFGRQIVFLDRVGRGWVDKDVILEEACRQLLVDYVVEEEMGYQDGINNRYERYLNSDFCGKMERMVIQAQIDVEKQIFTLYKWFTCELPRLEKRIVELSGQVPSETIAEMEAQLRLEKTEKLKELIDVRGALWT